MGLEEDFAVALNKSIEDVEKSRGLTLAELRSMISDSGGLGAVKHLLDKNFSSTGLLDLINLECSAVSIESLVVDPRFQKLFTKEQLAIAESRLPT